MEGVLASQALLLESTAGLRVDASVLLMVDIAVFLVLVTCLLVRIFLGGGSSAKTDAALLLGLPDSGKTSLFTQLKYGQLGKTVTSMRENETILDATESVGSVRLVDIPGHPRLRKLIRAFAGRARNVTFVIDSKSFSATSKENADLLLNILDESEFRKRKMLIACNKSDFDLMASSEAFIKKRLEKEIDMLLSTRGKDVISTDGEERHSLVESSVPEGEKFTFEALAQSAGGWQVHFEKCSAKKGGQDLVAVREFVYA